MKRMTALSDGRARLDQMKNENQWRGARNRRTNPDGPLGQRDLTCEMRICMDERAAICSRSQSRARQDRNAAAVARGDRQDVSENLALLAIGQVRNDPAVSDERIEIEYVDAGRNVVDQWIRGLIPVLPRVGVGYTL